MMKLYQAVLPIAAAMIAPDELEAAKATWAEATDKARIVQAKVEELKNSLGMNETLASAG
jgi:hypothetical protein